MNRHQVLTGASNSGHHCFAVGSVESVHFTAYAAGCDIVVLASDFQRVQIIPGAVHGNIQVSCIDCCTDAGKIAASYGKKVCIFEPTPLLHHDSSHKLDYQWYHTGTIEAECEVLALSWNQEGSNLLTAGDAIQMWQSPMHSASQADGESDDAGSASGVQFYIDEHEDQLDWNCVWHCRPATPVHQIGFSPDGLLFATLGKNDRLVKVWYENKKVQFPIVRNDSISPKREEVHFAFVYIAHPRAVMGFSWRKTSKYMPRGSVANMLITSCKDNICRVWSETILPEDGLVDVQQLDPTASQSPMYHTQRHKRRFLQRLHHVRHLMQRRNRQNMQGATGSNHPQTMSGPPSAISVHDFHKFGVHPNSVAPGFHLHLAASINPDTDIPLLPAMGTASGGEEPAFVVHWLNNKELHFTLEAERILEELASQSQQQQQQRQQRQEEEEEDLDRDSSTDPGDVGQQTETEGEDLSDTTDLPPSTTLMHTNSESTLRDMHAQTRKRRRLLMKSKSYLSTESMRSNASAISYQSGFSQITERATTDVKGTATDPLDHRIEALLRDWHQGADMLFSIHPLDGSYLLWLVDWMDEPNPGSFRQAQVSFSSRIPQAIPIGDAMSMAPHLLLHCNYGRVDLKAALKESESKTFECDKGGTMGSGGSSSSPKGQANAMGKNSPGQSDNTLMPNVLMISKHKNGSLNQWQVTFAEESHFTMVLSIAHASRVCGHRFQTNSAACHSVLPLLLTTSHHNVPDMDINKDADDINCTASECCKKRASKTAAGGITSSADGDPGPGGFCSELILWRVDPVGPLSKSGGITELARINSPEVSAFANVAWLPTLLPSSTLGNLSNSPSALFVASDGFSLRIYQAVIDARTLLAEVGGHKKKEMVNLSRSNSSGSSGWMQQTASTSNAAREAFNIVSLQSTARPGCIIEQDTVDNAKQDWQHIQLMHVFQEQLMTGTKTSQQYKQHPGMAGGPAASTGSPALEPIIDLQNITNFEEHFFLVTMERLQTGGSLLHMWRIVIDSHGGEADACFSPDVNYYQDHDGAAEDTPGSSRSATPETPFSESQAPHANIPRLSIRSTKVCTQMLELPEKVEVVCATVAAGHLSSSTIYPACFAPYLISAACSDSRVRFFGCKVTSGGGKESSQETQKYEWKEWEMMIPSEDTSTIRVPGKPMTVSCAYSGRVAVAYRMGGIKTRNDNPQNKYINLCVSIYECESTGGSEWSLEDTIELKNVTITDPKIELDLSVIYDENLQLDSHMHEAHSSQLISPTLCTPAIIKTVPIPSPTTVKSVKKMLSTKECKLDLLKPRHLVQLDWVSTEDGSHILTVAVGSKILLYSAVSSELSQATHKDQPLPQPRPSRGILQKSKSMTVQNFVEEIRWMKVRSLEVVTADGLPPLPMHVSWVRDGVLVVGMDNEMHVYSQWRGPGDGFDCFGEGLDQTDLLDSRTLIEQNLQKVSSASSVSTLSVTKSYKLSPSMSSIKLDASISNLSMLADKKEKDRRGKDINDGTSRLGKAELPKSDSVLSMTLMQDCGLFEAARLANPVLPQYHPKQLIELLNFGKIRRVKAILAHLVRCIAGGDHDSECMRQRLLSVPRGMTGASSPSDPNASSIPEESQLDYTEIHSIPPLPLYSLLAADDDPGSYKNVDGGPGGPNPTAVTPVGNTQDYSTLFNTDSFEDEGLEDPFSTVDEVFSPSAKSPRKRNIAQYASHPNYFGPGQSRLLASHLTHTHLPGLASLDQMYLLALADTVANTKLDFSDNQAHDVVVKATVDREQGQTDLLSTDSIDDCGLRFVLAARHHIYLMNTLTIRHRAQLQIQGLSPAYYIWAYHSEAEEELMNVLPSVQKGEQPTWSELRQFGAGWWIRNINTLRRCIEKLAKSSFQAKQDPLDAALFYLAMKKKNVVWGLFRSVSDSKMMEFFRNNFEEDRWRKAALKNAFALLARQRFQHAAAFFLLGGSVRDAIEVCLHKLDDIQLAMVISRLYDSELDDSMPSNLKRLMYEECLGCDQHGEDYDVTSVHPDPFLRSMAYWTLKDYSAALGTLLETSVGSARRFNESKNDVDTYSTNPSVFNFYNYLRTHPLLVRKHLATTAADQSQTVLLSGFSKTGKSAVGDKHVTYIERITPVERRLYFTTAHAHFKNGCPVLALEVLTKLPNVIDMENDITKSRSSETVTPRSPRETGTLDSDQKSSQFDWSVPLAGGGVRKDTTESLDWSQPVSSNLGGTAVSLDWSQPVSKFEDEKLDLGFEMDTGDEDSNTKSDSEVESKEKLAQSLSVDIQAQEEGKQKKSTGPGDIMAQQLKFIACLKIMMEELSTLATGFEVDGGQLRYQLYIWLEREGEVLQKVCNYGRDTEQPSTRTDKPSADSGAGSQEEGLEGKSSSASLDMASSKPTLHEIIHAEKMDFEAKLQRMAKRKRWLTANQQLLRTLLSYSVLHGSGGGSLASVRMELILLLQELQQEKTQQQLLSPLPFPTSLPLLSASVASAKTVIADPIRHLQDVTRDILHSIVEFKTPPVPSQNLSRVMVLRNLSAALSACIYQCLCDSDSFTVSVSDTVDIGMEGFTSTNVVYKDSYLMAGAQRRHKVSTSGDDLPNSPPAKWPGVASLRALLAKEKDEDAPKLNMLLCESLVAVYMSLLIHALSMYDANILYRLVGHHFLEKMWPALFGGGIRKLVKVNNPAEMQNKLVQPKDELAKQRMKLHMRVLGRPGSSVVKLKEDKPTYKEKFMPPELSMISYFMTKPFAVPGQQAINYDSADSVPSSDDEEEEEIIGSSGKNDCAMNEHLDPNSYSWCLMRYAIVKFLHHRLRAFLPQIGIELPELPVCSPLVQAVLRTLEQWEEILKGRLELFSGPPNDYIPGCFLDSTANGPTIFRYKAMMESLNTPFLSSDYSALPAKRLWHHLVNLEYLHDVFIRYIFKKKKPELPEVDLMRSEVSTDAPPKLCEEPMKLIHKEQDIITSFCVNQANLNCVTMATQKEIVEMDITGILYPPVWLEDYTEYDIETIQRPTGNRLEPEEFLVVQTAADTRRLVINASASSPGNAPPTAPGAFPAPNPSVGPANQQSGRGGSVLCKRSVGGVRRMGAHPHLPYYLTGSQDGSVRLWEWGHNHCIAVARQPGSFPKVTKVLFNAQGNKFGVSDGEGSVCLWQVGLGVNMNKPFLSLKCHNKTTSDFVFVGSSSMLATAGHSSESRNVCLWDTLLPKRNSLVQAFHCHQDGSPAVLYAPQHQVLISAGKKGDVSIIDVRQRQLRHTFQAHDSAIKCLTLDPCEEFFVTGSADGDVKVWALTVHSLVYSFPGEHTKGSIFRNVGSGVTQVYVSPQNHLFSCGADGSMKVRQLPQRETIVNSFTGSSMSSTL